MTGAQKLAMAAGVAGLLALGVVERTTARENPPASSQPTHNPPAQAHPGQAAPRTAAPRSSHGTPNHATPSTPAAGHGEPAASHDEHAGTPGAHADHADGQAPEAAGHGVAGSPDELTPTYFGQTPDADTALTILRDGNARWVSGNTQNPRSDESTRRDTAENGQHPFAAILTCADSRLPVERVFDRGVGELFVIRVAGNVVAETEAGTLEYGVEHLHTPVIVVMGHTSCGAVKAACEGGEAGGNVRFLIGEIEPAVRRASTMHPSLEGDELVAEAVRENVMQSMFDLLATSESIRTNVDNGTVRLVGAVYNISTGEVEFLGEHPWQDGLISVMSDRAANVAGGHVTAEVMTETTGGRAGH